MIREVGAEKLAEINKEVVTDVDLVYEALDQLRNIMASKNNGTTSRLVEFFRFCSSVVTSEGPSADVSSATTESNYSTIFDETSVPPFGGNVKLQESTSVSNTPNMTLHVATETGNASLSQMSATSTQYESSISSSVSSSQTGLPTSNVNNVTLTANDTGFEKEEDEEDYQYPWLNITSLDQCREAYRKSIKYIDDIIARA